MSLFAPEEPWMAAALCRRVGEPDDWYADGKSGPARYNDHIAVAVHVCRKCPVRAQCLEYALEHDERWGIWGGLTEQQREGMCA